MRQRNSGTDLPIGYPATLKTFKVSCDELPPNIDLHHFIERDAVLAAIVELGGAGRGMRRHLAGLLERAAVLEVGRDARAAEGVVAHMRGDAGRLGATAYHLPGIGPVQPFAVELRLPTTVGANLDGWKRGTLPT